jgi:cell division protein ZipA
MEIFHHFGIAPRRGARPLFSLADMFEPGSFPLQQLAERHSSGLVLFFCLPAPGDARMILDLMLNTADRIASSLDAEVLGPHQEPLTDESVSELRALVAAQA